MAIAIEHFSRASPEASERMIAVEAAALSDAYRVLAAMEGTTAQLPCAALLQEIGARLVAMFGGPARVRFKADMSELLMGADERRALGLIASELVINALKYAFPLKGGTITMTLASSGAEAELVVEDDGVGLPPGGATGAGGGALIGELCEILRGEIARSAGPQGRGLKIGLRWPVAGGQPRLPSA